MRDTWDLKISKLVQEVLFVNPNLVLLILHSTRTYTCSQSNSLEGYQTKKQKVLKLSYKPLIVLIGKELHCPNTISHKINTTLVTKSLQLNLWSNPDSNLGPNFQNPPRIFTFLFFFIIIIIALFFNLIGLWWKSKKWVYWRGPIWLSGCFQQYGGRAWLGFWDLGFRLKMSIWALRALS